MVDALYAVKVDAGDEWPFALFKDLSGAIACVNSMHAGTDSKDLMATIKRVPAFRSFEIFDADDALRCSEEVR